MSNWTREQIINELKCLAGEEELKAYESGDFDSEEIHLDKAKILRTAALMLTAPW